MMRLLISIGLVACGGRTSSSQSAEPVEYAPLPPASGTPIGILLDDASALTLSDVQLDELRAIDRDLASAMEKLDGGAASRGAGPGGPPAGRGGRGGARGGGGGRTRGTVGASMGGVGASMGSGGASMTGGGMGGGGMGGGGMGGRGPGGGGTRAGRGATGEPGPPPQASSAHHELVREAFTRAFAILDDKQIEIAWDLLVARDIDPTTLLEPSAGTRSPGSPRRAR